MVAVADEPVLAVPAEVPLDTLVEPGSTVVPVDVPVVGELEPDEVLGLLRAVEVAPPVVAGDDVPVKPGWSPAVVPVADDAGCGAAGAVVDGSLDAAGWLLVVAGTTTTDPGSSVVVGRGRSRTYAVTEAAKTTARTMVECRIRRRHRWSPPAPPTGPDGSGSSRGSRPFTRPLPARRRALPARAGLSAGTLPPPASAAPG